MDISEEEYRAGLEEYNRLNNRFKRGWTIVFIVALLWYGLVMTQPEVCDWLNHLLGGA